MSAGQIFGSGQGTPNEKLRVTAQAAGCDHNVYGVMRRGGCEL